MTEIARMASDRVDEVFEAAIEISDTAEPTEEFREHVSGLTARADLRHDDFQHSPSVAAAACVYTSGLLVNQKLTQAEVAEAAGVTVRPVSLAHRKLAECEGLVADDDAEDETEESGLVERIIGVVLG